MSQQFINGVEMNRLHPDTFEIPSPEEKSAIRPGDFIKVGFKEGGETERMWLEVKAITPEGLFQGTLDNDPIVVSVNWGDSFTVHPDNILSIHETPK